MHRFFVDKVIDSNIVIIDNENDVRHISKSLRVKAGEKLEVCDLSNKEYIVEVKTLEDDFIECEVIEKSEISRESNINIDLYQGLAKGSKMDFIIQKSVELGVRSVYPMMTKRTIIKLDDKSKSKKVLRWQKISDEAAKQSKRGITPKVEDIVDLKDYKKIFLDYDLVLIAYELEKNLSLKSILKEKEYKNIAVLIGPEGGFEEEEVLNLVEENHTSISLGNRILRTETAGITIISILQYEIGDIGGI